jgi:hypothetical protein
MPRGRDVSSRSTSPSHACRTYLMEDLYLPLALNFAGPRSFHTNSVPVNTGFVIALVTDHASAQPYSL